MSHHQFLTPVRFILGPLMTMAIEHHLPTQVEHSWRGVGSTPHPVHSGVSLSHSSGVSSTKADQVVPSSETDSQGHGIILWVGH